MHGTEVVPSYDRWPGRVTVGGLLTTLIGHCQQVAGPRGLGRNFPSPAVGQED